MIRRFAVVLLVVLGGIQTFAQGATILYNLSGRFTVNDLGFTFAYPVDWVFRATETGIYLAPTEADLDILTDGDPATNPSNVYITVAALPTSVLLEDPTTATISEVADAVRDAVQLNDLLRIEFGVMGRHAITSINTSPFPSYVTLWRQDETLVLMSMVFPDEATLGTHGATWGTIVGGSIGVTAAPLPERYEWEQLNLSMSHPSEWTVFPESYAIAEFEEDALGIADATYVPKSYVVGMLRLNLNLDAEAIAETTRRQFAEEMVTLFTSEIDTYVYEELHGANAPAFGLKITFVDGRQTFVAGFVNTLAPSLDLLTLGAPNAEAAEAILDTWYMMVQSAQVIELPATP